MREKKHTATKRCTVIKNMAVCQTCVISLHVFCLVFCLVDNIFDDFLKYITRVFIDQWLD